MNMYFVALVAPVEINQQLLKWKQLMFDRFSCSAAMRSPAHITLIPPFWMQNELEAELKIAITEFSKLRNPFLVQLENFNFFKPRVIFVDVNKSNELQQLQKELSAYLHGQNEFAIKQDDRLFHPHVTIATRDLHKKSFYEAWEIFRNKKFVASWLISSISLLRHNKKNWDVIFTSQFNTHGA